ncbi:hypothetical protein GFK82_00494 [Candidatus Steffania adelgidicola]|nr:hypothetical protein GFK82_00494 [Candidatus Steffania adelgidicola]
MHRQLLGFLEAIPKIDTDIGRDHIENNYADQVIQ